MLAHLISCELLGIRLELWVPDSQDRERLLVGADYMQIRAGALANDLEHAGHSEGRRGRRNNNARAAGVRQDRERIGQFVDHFAGHLERSHGGQIENAASRINRCKKLSRLAIASFHLFVDKHSF